MMGITMKKLLYYLVKSRNKIFLLFVILYILVAAYIALWLEPQTFKSYLTAVYWVFTTLATVGFGDYAPVTHLGKLFTILLYITGIALVSSIIGKIIESVYLIEKLKVGGNMKYTGKNHIILIGWSDKSKLAIQEILNSDKTTDIVIIDNIEKAPIIEERLFYVRGDATDQETLLRANFPKAKGVIIFADQTTQDSYATKDPLLVDGKTLLIATAMTSIEEKNGSINSCHCRGNQSKAYRFIQARKGGRIYPYTRNDFPCSSKLFVFPWSYPHVFRAHEQAV
ncbi:ion channel [Bacillus sp. OTU530]|uniref:ion channel n=1 Tax=Bacillus sp. OTU530 TaxID=3043862 RepID=UPI00313EDCB8